MANISRRSVQKKVAATELARALTESGNISAQDAEVVTRLDELLSNENSPIQDKVEGLRNIQVLLLSPQIKALLGLDEFDILSDKKARQARDIHWTIDGIIKGLYEQHNFTQREEIDFHHPKVQKAFEFLVQGALETMKEMHFSEEQINDFVERFSTAMIGFESELDSRMYGVSGTSIDKVENPLLKKFKEARQEKEKQSNNDEDTLGEFTNLRSFKEIAEDIVGPDVKVTVVDDLPLDEDE